MVYCLLATGVLMLSEASVGQQWLTASIGLREGFDSRNRPLAGDGTGLREPLHHGGVVGCLCGLRWRMACESVLTRPGG